MAPRFRNWGIVWCRAGSEYLTSCRQVRMSATLSFVGARENEYYFMSAGESECLICSCCVENSGRSWLKCTAVRTCARENKLLLWYRLWIIWWHRDVQLSVCTVVDIKYKLFWGLDTVQLRVWGWGWSYVHSSVKSVYITLCAWSWMY